MKICIVDDDISILNILNDIITDNMEDAIVYTADSATEAIRVIDQVCPEIVLLDYLMPDHDGLYVIKKIRRDCNPEFIMISEVSDKEMIAKAYNQSISFFINKPINVIEVLAVLNRVIEHQNLRQTFSQVKSALNMMGQKDGSIEPKKITDEEKLRQIYSRVGIAGVSGCDELIKAVKWAQKQKNDYTLLDLYKALGEKEENYDAVKKRMHRVVSKSFSAMASLGIEDNLNPVFEEYAMRLFDYQELRKEMMYQEGKGTYRGKINIRHFIESSIVLMQEL